jgi:hypothetical protein
VADAVATAGPKILDAITTYWEKKKPQNDLVAGREALDSRIGPGAIYSDRAIALKREDCEIRGPSGSNSNQDVAVTTSADLGSYEVFSALGSGETGEAYRAREATIGRNIVLAEEFAHRAGEDLRRSP